MRVFGLIGKTLSHSFSKKYFTEKFEKEGLTDCRYELFPIEKIDDILGILNYPDLEGLNVTIPYKEDVLSYLSTVSNVVKNIGACNCIKITQNGLAGYNTDVMGFRESVLPLLKKEHKSALILGTGGAAKAIAYVLHTLDIECKMVSRTPQKDQFSYFDISSGLLADYKLIINTTPAGMYPNEDICPILDFNGIGSNHFLYDIIYNPEMTVFLKKGKERGAVVKNGLEMLRIQAKESWKIWNNFD